MQGNYRRKDMRERRYQDKLLVLRTAERSGPYVELGSARKKVDGEGI